MSKKQLLVLMGVVATAGLAAAAPAERTRAEGDRTARISAWREELGLSDDQVSQIQKLRSDARRLAIRRRADTQLARLNLQDAVQASPVDEKLVQARTKELSDLHAANLRARVDMGLAVRKILTPEQQQRARDLRGERRRERQERRRNDGDRGEPKR